MTLSTVTAFSGITDKAPASPAYFLSKFSEVYDNLNAMNASGMADVRWINALSGGYGVTGNGTTDDAPYLQAANDAALGQRTLFIPASVSSNAYRIASTLTLNTHIYASDASFYIDGGQVVFGTTVSGSVVRQKQVRCPRIQNVSIDSSAWSGTGVGMTFSNALECEVSIPYITGFNTGLLVQGVGTGSVYNTFTIGNIQNNLRNIRVVNGTGWANANTFLGGQLAYTTGAQPTPTARHILLEDTGAAEPPNGNIFLGQGVEGNVPQYHVECQGNSNMFIGLRWEATTPVSLFTGADAEFNIVEGGYGISDVSFVQTNGANRNTIRGADRLSQTVHGTGNGTWLLQNNSNSQPIIRLYPSAATLASAGTDWTYWFGSDRWQGKATSDITARLYLDPTQGIIYFTDGTLATPQIGTYLQYVGANLRLVGGWLALGNSYFSSPSYNTSGLATLPSVAFSSESSLGFYRSATSTVALSYGTASFPLGTKMSFQTGTNASFGTVQLGSNGSVNVATTVVTPNSVVFITPQTDGGTIGTPRIIGVRTGSGFTIQSTNILDTSVVAWWVVEPRP